RASKGGIDYSTNSQPPASPSTQEAIQGMLSMANLSSSDSLQQPKRPTKRLPKKPRKSSSIESLDYDDDQDHMDACFKDSDYDTRALLCSPQLSHSCLHAIKKNEKAVTDTPYSPTARVGPSVPRQERPARDGARVASIETGLAAAAAKLSHQDSSSPEHTVDDGSLTDPEFNTGTVKSPGGPQPMAPGVFLSQ
ncbi:hypothetical protein KUCAC02_031134, partial [Chaenocephalus aceratus]